MKNKTNNKLALFLLQQLIRDFFNSKGFLDVQTPPMVENPGMEPHIHPFKILKTQNQEVLNQYLHTSPEFCMKELLSLGLTKIFTQSFCFRDEPTSEYHRSQFIMLEWYRKNEPYTKIMEDCSLLFEYLLDELPKKGIKISKKFDDFTITKKTIKEIFKEVLDINILDYLEIKDLFDLIENQFKNVPLPSTKEEKKKLTWDDLYFLLFLNLIEPELKKYPLLILDEFPCHLSALSSIKKDDPRVCNRFELYSFGVELANCFGELADLKEQKKRFSYDKKLKKELYNYQLPEPTTLYKALETGIGESSGVALGVERLLGILTGTKNPFYY